MELAPDDANGAISRPVTYASAQRIPEREAIISFSVS